MTELKGYHAHVYYDQATRPTAERLRDTIISRFAVKPGAFSDEPIGPHPKALPRDTRLHAARRLAGRGRAPAPSRLTQEEPQ